MMVHHAAQVICAWLEQTDSHHFGGYRSASLGRRWRGLVSACWFRDPVLERVNKFNSRCTEAQLLGFCLKSHRKIVVDFDGRFRMVRTIKRAHADDRWKVVSPRDPFSGADLESTPAEFTFSRGTRGDVNPAAQRLERHPVDALPPNPDHDPVPRRLYLMQRDFMAHVTSDHCLGCRAHWSVVVVHEVTLRNVESALKES